VKDYWIADSEGRVLGPVGVDVLKDLILAGRQDLISRVSLDGSTWGTLEEVPELAQLTFHRTTSSDRTGREKQEAANLRSQLEALRIRPAHEIFKVPKDAAIEVYRDAFFRLSKKFHPDSLPKNVDAELADACAIAFRFLSGLMNQVEAAMLGVARDAASSERRTGGPRQAAELPRYDAEEFIGIKPLANGGVQASIRVTAENVNMFTDHPMMNLQHGSFFLADDRVLPLGTTVSVTFTFEDPPHTIIARGRVAWEDVGRSGSAHGFGITFQDLRDTDRKFIREFIERSRKPSNALSGRRSSYHP
jgi:Tfp pilus assembly protein PilZ